MYSKTNQSRLFQSNRDCEEYPKPWAKRSTIRERASRSPTWSINASRSYERIISFSEFKILKYQSMAHGIGSGIVIYSGQSSNCLSALQYVSRLWMSGMFGMSGQNTSYCIWHALKKVNDFSVLLHFFFMATFQGPFSMCFPSFNSHCPDSQTPVGFLPGRPSPPCHHCCRTERRLANLQWAHSPRGRRRRRLEQGLAREVGFSSLLRLGCSSEALNLSKKGIVVVLLICSFELHFLISVKSILILHL